MVTAFNQAEAERTKLNDLLVQTQDKSLKRISQLREQSTSDKKAKDQLESSLGEKSEEIVQLQAQVKLSLCYLL